MSAIWIRKSWVSSTHQVYTVMYSLPVLAERGRRWKATNRRIYKYVFLLVERKSAEKKNASKRMRTSFTEKQIQVCTVKLVCAREEQSYTCYTRMYRLHTCTRHLFKEIRVVTYQYMYSLFWQLLFLPAKLSLWSDRSIIKLGSSCIHTNNTSWCLIEFLKIVNEFSPHDIIE